MELVFIDIDNTLLDFDEYIRRTMREGFAHFGLKHYEPYMEEIFHRENGKLWRQIEQGTLTFAELERIRWNNVFAALDIDFDGTVFENVFSRRPVRQRHPRARRYGAAGGAPREIPAGRGQQRPLRAAAPPVGAGGDEAAIFDWFFISERLGASKPVGGVSFDGAFAAAERGARRAHACRRICVIIGDSLTSDMAGGRQYGMKTCYYRRPGAPEGADVTWQVTDLRQIPALLEGSGI